MLCILISVCVCVSACVSRSPYAVTYVWFRPWATCVFFSSLFSLWRLLSYFQHQPQPHTCWSSTRVSPTWVELYREKKTVAVTVGCRISKLSLCGFSSLFVFSQHLTSPAQKRDLCCGRKKQHIAHLRTFNTNQEVTPAVNLNTHSGLLKTT